MSGHSKWSQIKRAKGVTDARRGQLFTKLAREITLAARQGGGDQTANFRLRMAVQKSRDNNMPLDNIDRAIKRGTGEAGSGVDLAEVTYEGYAPGGAAILVQAMTDNKNRALAEVRKVFNHNSGTLGEVGCVGWIFDPKGVISVQATEGESDDLALSAIDAGAEDVKMDGDSLEVFTSPEKMEEVRGVLEEQKATVLSSDVHLVPNTTMPLEGKSATLALRLLDLLDELDDVQKVYSNADFPDEVLAEAAG